MNAKERKTFRDLLELCDSEKVGVSDTVTAWIDRTDMERTVRVTVHDTHTHIESIRAISSLLMADGDYLYEDVPRWVKERVAVLSITAPPPPPHPVPGVGIRIGDGVFWVVAPDEEDQWQQPQKRE